MPVYSYNDHECVSAGVLFCRRSTQGVELLLLSKNDKNNNCLLEDPGGKSAPDDVSIQECAAREAAEELNGLIQDPLKKLEYSTYQEKLDSSKAFILDLINKRPICLVNKRTRYALFVVEIPDLGDIDFGTHEIHAKYDIKREVVWLTAVALFNKPLKSIHPRIRHLLSTI